MKNLAIAILAGIVIALSVYLLYGERQDIARHIDGMGSISYANAKRSAAAKADIDKQSPIVIGVIGDESEICFKSIRKGVKLAADLCNASGGIAGRKVSLLEKNDRGEDRECKLAIQDFSENKDVVAVIGPLNYSQMLSTEPICEFNGMLLMSPCITSELIPDAGSFRFSFINFPKVSDFTDKLVEFMTANGLRSTVILSSPEYTYGYYFANAFDASLPRAPASDAGVIDRKTVYNLERLEFVKGALEIWRASHKFDSVLITGDTPLIKKAIRTANETKLDTVFMLDDEMEIAEIAKMPECQAGNVFVPSVYDPGSEKPAAVKFRAEFKNKFSAEPDAWAVQGYDTFNVIAAAISKANSSVPERIADALRVIRFDGNVSEAPFIAFDEDGNLSSGKTIVKRVSDGAFKTVKDLKLPKPSAKAP